MLGSAHYDSSILQEISGMDKDGASIHVLHFSLLLLKEEMKMMQERGGGGGGGRGRGRRGRGEERRKRGGEDEEGRRGGREGRGEGRTGGRGVDVWAGIDTGGGGGGPTLNRTFLDIFGDIYKRKQVHCLCIPFPLPRKKSGIGP